MSWSFDLFLPTLLALPFPPFFLFPFMTFVENLNGQE